MWDLEVGYSWGARLAEWIGMIISYSYSFTLCATCRTLLIVCYYGGFFIVYQLDAYGRLLRIEVFLSIK